jgi:hypothetical protein
VLCDKTNADVSCALAYQRHEFKAAASNCSVNIHTLQRTTPKQQTSCPALWPIVHSEQQHPNLYLLHLQIVPALTTSQLAEMNAAEGTGSPPLQPPPTEVTCLVFEYRRLPTTPTRRSASITAEAAPAAAAAADVANSSSSSSSSLERSNEYAYIIRERIPPIPKNSSSNGSSGSSGSSSSSSSSADSGSSSSSSARRQVLQSASNVARQDMLLVYTVEAAVNSFNHEYVRASMVNYIAITNKVAIITEL